jgi:hypothetical protein
MVLYGGELELVGSLQGVKGLGAAAEDHCCSWYGTVPRDSPSFHLRRTGHLLPLSTTHHQPQEGRQHRRAEHPSREYSTFSTPTPTPPRLLLSDSPTPLNASIMT